LARQPLLDLEAERDSKMLILKREIENLVKLEKPLVEGLDAAKKLAEQANDEFQMLGTKNPQLKAPAMFYIPFYVACYQTGSANRYLFFAPSMTSAVGFGVKLKGVMGISNIKEMITPRFKAITVLIEKVQLLAKQDSLLNQQITDLGERNNLLRNELTRVNIAKGLVYLKDAGWLSQREYQSLANSLAQS
jgi:prefoldin subunit 5